MGAALKPNSKENGSASGKNGATSALATDAADDWDDLIAKSEAADAKAVEKKLPDEAPDKKAQQQENGSKAAAGLAQQMAVDMAKDHDEVLESKDGQEAAGLEKVDSAD